jgi:hypothetical protein
MTDIRIVCARDAVKTAETLRRLLEAEQHQVNVSIGRHSLDQFEHALSTREVVVLIWSANAPGAHYMFEWAESFEPKRLIEVASAPGWPSLPHSAPVIDFTGWNGTRGGKSWLALSERLKPFLRVREVRTVSQPQRAAMALGFAAAAAMVGAVVVRVHAGSEGAQASPEQDALHVVPTGGVGGPFETLPSQAIEPPSATDTTVFIPARIARPALLDVTPEAPLMDVPDVEVLEFHRPTLLERIGELNPFHAREPDSQ